MLSIPVSFFIPQGTLPWQTVLGKIDKMTIIQHPGKKAEYRNMDNQLYSANNPSTSCTNMVCPVTTEIEM